LTSSRSIDLNADLGEHDGDGFAHDEAILDVVSSASIACGAHAGNPAVMRRTVVAAHSRGVSIGAHPGFPDREGFGRRESGLSISEIGDSVADQIEELAKCCLAEGARLGYVKPHGALYNRAVSDTGLAEEISQRIAMIDDSLIVLTLPHSALADAATRIGLEVAREAFIDRAYLPDGTLVPRSRDGAVIHDVHSSAARAVEMIRDGRVTAIDGSQIEIDAQSFCVHGDSVSALETVSEARRLIEAAGFSVKPFAQ